MGGAAGVEGLNLDLSSALRAWCPKIESNSDTDPAHLECHPNDSLPNVPPRPRHSKFRSRRGRRYMRRPNCGTRTPRTPRRCAGGLDRTCRELWRTCSPDRARPLIPAPAESYRGFLLALFSSSRAYRPFRPTRSTHTGLSNPMRREFANQYTHF